LVLLVTRPQPDNEATAKALRGKGFEVALAPMLRFEPVALTLDPDTPFGGVIVSSANALRALEGQDGLARLLKLPLFAVGKQTAKSGCAAGFGKIIVADGDASALRDSILDSVRKRRLRKSDPLLYLAGADLARDLAGELAAHGLRVVTQTTYRMVAVPTLPSAVRDAFAAGEINAVLHYSRRSARSFVAATRAAGIEITALAVAQFCLSDAVAAELREAGAAQVAAARKPDESALLDLLDRALGTRAR
jgi:uroporphyrinogen-III synthase